MLWDKTNHTIMNNESSEIIRIFNTAFNDVIPAEKAALDIYPEEHRAKIDELNEWIYPNINGACSFCHTSRSLRMTDISPDGVYQTGLARSQEAYEKAVLKLFQSLDKVEKLLIGKDYIVGDTLTECDIRLWVTIVCGLTMCQIISQTYP